MAKKNDHLADFETENTGGVLGGLLAEEEHLDRRALLRLGTWGAASVGAIIIAVLTNQSSLRLRRDEFAAADLSRQAQQIQSVARESQNETRRLAVRHRYAQWRSRPDVFAPDHAGTRAGFRDRRDRQAKDRGDHATRYACSRFRHCQHVRDPGRAGRAPGR